MEDQFTTIEPRGKNKAIDCLAFGIASIAISWVSFSVYMAFIPIILGIVGLYFRREATKIGYEGKLTVIGKRLSIIGIVLSSVIGVISLIIIIVAAVSPFIEIIDIILGILNFLD